MCKTELRLLDVSEVAAARDLYNAFPGYHASYVLQRQPEFFNIARLFDPDPTFFAHQRLVVGAFVHNQLIGTVSVELATELTEANLPSHHEFWERYGQHDLDVYSTLNESLTQTYIGTPNGAYTIHSLAVTPDHRRKGIATALLRYVIRALTQEEKTLLYIEFARHKSLIKLGAAVGFAPVRKTFSLSERLEYGCWGSVLMRYATQRDG